MFNIKRVKHKIISLHFTLLLSYIYTHISYILNYFSDKDRKVNEKKLTEIKFTKNPSVGS